MTAILKTTYRSPCALPDHELLQLFEALEVGVGALEFSDCQEEKLVKDFLLVMWRVTMWRTITKEAK